MNLHRHRVKEATTMKRAILATTLLTLAFAQPAQAQHGSLTRSFVSSSGVDTNACTITAPCASFAVAYTKISANGIIAALDPGKYGPITITGPVTIDGNGWAAITAPANSNGITINAGSNDKITLKGLTIDGVGAANDGILFNTGGGLRVDNCEIKNTLFNGIYVGAISPMSLLVSDTVISNINSAATSSGIYFYNGAANINVATLDHVAIADASVGVSLYANGGPVQAMISESQIVTSTTGFVTQGVSSTNAVTAVFRSVKLSSEATGIDIEGFTNIFVSQVVQTPSLADYGIVASGNANSIFSDNTNHFSSTCCAMSTWNTQ
jgi:hypothetical protein